MLTRREFIGSAIVGAAAVAVRTHAADVIHTVRGPIAGASLGTTLVHEHVLVDFIGAGKVTRDRYDRGQVVARVLPYLRQLREAGCRTLVECTPAFIGRDPLLLRRVADAADLNILTNTGYYGAADDKFVPPHAWTESARQLADRWTRETREGIEGTGIRPAFMKIGVDAGPLSPIDAKLVTAAALTHRETGLVIGSHTGNGEAALAQLDLLERHGVSPSAFIWIHAQNEQQASVHAEATDRGAWVSFDGVSESSLGRHVDLVRRMYERGVLDRVLVSQDAGWYHVGEPNGGEFRPYTFLFERFLPALADAGVRNAAQQLLVENPRRAFAART
jgi:phosphotriesterase-related protein